MRRRSAGPAWVWVIVLAVIGLAVIGFFVSRQKMADLRATEVEVARPDLPDPEELLPDGPVPIPDQPGVAQQSPS
ncbi:hypothetical protein Q0812_09680 [Brevundimonas sp. 2R-24]|uniref:SPOR domain-containing protein n=1 Tax=Peiella sedimenti TaxID=3061083 RepID=A0ABT8SMW1_9CAUL|nr:hypothetical protein [Caulobacteraceae bacterium XZ-24]